MPDAERPCERCGKSVGDDAAGHVCADSELRATKADTPSQISAANTAAVGPPAGGGNGKKPAGPTSARVTAQISADRADRVEREPLPEAPPPGPAPQSAVAALAAKLAVATEKVPLEVVVEEEVTDPLIGTLLGEHYRIIERLGRGGMGSVYLVAHIHLKKKFAAKLLNTETAQRADALARFQQEAVSASKLDQENIIDIVNFGKSEDDTPYLIMEFLRGEALNQILAKGPMSLDDIVRVVVPMCRGLSAAHGAGIVHRDLKPENVFVSRKGGGRHVVKLLDFGISRVKHAHFEDKRITQTGDVLGSPLYMSPEASRGDADVDGRADIYAIGVLLYEMTTGRVPFSADNYLQVLYKHIQETPQPPRLRNPDLPPAVEAVILKCLEKEPADRYQRCEELEAALVAAVPDVDLDAPISAAASAILTSIDVPIPGSPAGEPGASPSGSRARGTPPAMPGATPISPSGAQKSALSGSGRRPLPDVPNTPALVLPPPGGSRFGLIAGFIGTLGILGFGAYALWQSHASGEGDSEIVKARVEPVSPVPTPAPQIKPPVAVEPQVVTHAELTVDTTPPGAAVILDGAEIGHTPLTMSVAPDPRERNLRVELAGYKPEARPVVLDRSRAVELTLKKIVKDRPEPKPLDIKEGR